jgi:membrane protein
MVSDRSLQWNDVVIGALVTSVLFNIGKSLIGWYIGSSAVASSCGAAAGLIVLLLWVYYSVQIFLLGAEFTKIYANRRGLEHINQHSEHLRDREHHSQRCDDSTSQRESNAGWTASAAPAGLSPQV